MFKTLKMHVLVIDPGTSRWGFAFFEGSELADEASVSTDEVRSDPKIALDFAEQADVAVAPSGYGIPLKHVKMLGKRDFFEILLKRDGGKVMGLQEVLELFKAKEVNAYVIPGVKLLPTVAGEKKRDKIDMGTPDKLCAAVAGVVEQSQRLDLHYSEADFVLTEMGYGFDAFLKIEGGRIVDGIGGTNTTSSGFREDGEILYLRGEISKESLKRDPNDLENIKQGAYEDISGLLGEGDELLVSGSQSDKVFDFLKSKFKNTRRLEMCRSGNAAYGAAVIADGLAGSKYSEFINHLKIRDAKGSNLDYTTLE
jgi:predicted butyrate kinase (DUF1464 family)